MVQPLMSDQSIKQRVIDELNWDPAIDASNIIVGVNNGMATLSGSVPTYSQMYQADQDAKSVYGVLSVVNNLNIMPPPEFIRSDAEITDATYNALKWDTMVPSNRINASVSTGWVTLTGNVDWHYQKEAAENDVRNLPGVTGVTDLITVTPPYPTPSDVKSKIEGALKRSAKVEANRINVDVTGGHVTLTGTVHSWDERESAEDAAWSAPGVTDVDDQLIVTY